MRLFWRMVVNCIAIARMGVDCIKWFFGKHREFRNEVLSSKDGLANYFAMIRIQAAPSFRKNFLR